MGVFRKVASVSTLGLVSFHESERKTERRLAALTADEVAESRKQTSLMRRQLALQQHTAAQAEAHLQPPIAAVSYPQPVVPNASWQGNGNAAQRIAQLDSLLQQHLITPQEHAQQRQAIISGI